MVVKEVVEEGQGGGLGGGGGGGETSPGRTQDTPSIH